MFDADSQFVANLMPQGMAINTLTVEDIDASLIEVDRRVTVITNHMRSIRKSLLSAPPKPLTDFNIGAVAPVLHVRFVFKLTGLEAALEANLALRNKLVHARSLASEAA